MEGQAHDNEQLREVKSSVKLVLNAKGEAQIEVKVVAGETQEEVDRVKLIALETFIELRKELGR